MRSLLFIFWGLCLSIQSFAQTESCVVVTDEITKNKGIWSQTEIVDYVLLHQDAFDMENPNDVWLYNLLLGVNYYGLNKYHEAQPYLNNLTIVCDEVIDEIDFSTNAYLLDIYYWEAACELYLGYSKNKVIAKYKKLKSVIEKHAPAAVKLHQQVVADIETLDRGFNIPAIASKSMEYMLANKYDEAILLLEPVLNHWTLPKEKKLWAELSRLLGDCYLTVDKLKEAELVYLSTLSTLDKDKLEHLSAYRVICTSLGGLYCKVHNYEKGKSYLVQSKLLHEQYMDFDDSYIRVLVNCAMAEDGLGNKFVAKLFIDVALKYMRNGAGYQAAEAFRQNIQPIESFGKSNFDNVAQHENVDKVFQLYPYLAVLSNAAVIYQESGFWDEAVMCTKEGIDLGEKYGIPTALGYNNMGTLYLYQSRADESLPYFEKAISQCENQNEKLQIWFNYALALWFSHSDKKEMAAMKSSEILASSIFNNFAFLSQEERYNYYQPISGYLPLLNVILLEDGHSEHFGYIYDNILMSKGLLLRSANAVKDAIMQSKNKELMAKYNRLVTLRQQQSKANNEVQQSNMAQEIDILDKELARKASEYGVFSLSNKMGWKEVMQNLKKGDIAIEFYNIPLMNHSDSIQKIEAEPRFCAVMLKKGCKHPKIIPLCKESELEDYDVDLLYHTDELYRLIWAPLEAELKGMKNIYFSADQALHKIGIEYALLPDGSRMDEVYNLYRLSSTRVLAEKKVKKYDANAVLYGGLQYDVEPQQLIAESRSGTFHSNDAERVVGLSDLRYGVKYLPGTKEEVDDIYKNFQDSKNTKCEVISDIAGTEESFKSLASSNVGIIHLATHGFYWNEADAERRSYTSFLSSMNKQKHNYEDKALLRSGLFFAGANIGLAGKELPDDVEDGVLTAFELSAMNLGQVDMVVLSACQSGLGEISGGGVFGLQRGFKLAGANTLLMSLWKVDDEATKLLMTAFYRHFLSGKSKRESLKQAQLELRQNPLYSDPEYWAGFILLDALD